MKNIPKKKNVKWFLIILLCVGNMNASSAQDQTKVTERVIDVYGELLIGVNVTEVDKPSVGVITDVNGTYTTYANSNEVPLKYSYIGFKDKLVKVGSKGILDVSMEENAVALDKVVVVGYGIIQKKSFCGRKDNNYRAQNLSMTLSCSLSNN